MPSITSTSLLTALAGAVSVAAHGHVRNIVINGVSYQGYEPSMSYMPNPPKVVGWTASNQDNGFVAPDAFASGDIICHKSAKNAGGHAVVAAGDRIFIQWDTWPESHHGPVIDYLANCGDAGCETVDKTSLEFFKIDEVGLVDGTSAPGFWGSDQLIANNNSWLVEIPSNIKPGFYVLRHEIIALHSAGQANGAQNYPQCFNLQVTGSGTASPAGVLGTKLYTPTDKGILANIYTSPVTYEIPGPALIEGAASIEQSSSAITSSATAITGSASAPAAVATTTTGNAAATTTAASSTTAAPVQTSAAASAAPVASSTSTRPRPTGCANAKRRRHARDLAKRKL
ncbi:glycoside hydrolase family 61 protein [Chaetomium strumarium]|uniref:lytic cellulose monooxygenase (C4-dehydrogenating) n=1 Tax=Chaetomium strumarium TaxID=1170767 RepID=A0AAJ0LZF7_9PEZI|nr:glycoside hydrolase family 61 protein [Chaetomium strumarium]